LNRVPNLQDRASGGNNNPDTGKEKVLSKEVNFQIDYLRSSRYARPELLEDDRQ
jgi:hypothetical protein